MPYILPIKVMIQRTLLGDYPTLSTLLGLTAILLGLGFLLSGPTYANPNYVLLYALAPKLFWAISFLVYGTIKTISAIFRVWSSLKITVTVYGLWLWNYLAMSFTVFDKTALAPTELMLFITVIGELWVLTLILYNRKNFRR